MPKESVFVLLAVLFGFLALMFIQMALQSEQAVQLPYSAFKADLAASRIQEVSITDSVIRGTLKVPGPRGKAMTEPFVTVRVSDPDLVRQLEAKQVEFTGVIQHTWLKDLFFLWILPIGVLWLIGWLLFKKLGPGSGMLSLGGLGKTKAKIYAPLQLPTEDRYLLTRSELLDRLAVMLGGRVAEELTFGEVSTGAQNDLQRAADTARRMVMEYGMSERLGPVAYEPERHPVFLPIADGFGSRPYSEETAREIDEEVRRIVEGAHTHARSLLTKRGTDLQAIASGSWRRRSWRGRSWSSC